MDKKVMSQILSKRSAFTVKQWERLIEQLEKRNLFICIEAVSTAKSFLTSEVLIPIANKEDSILLLTVEELENKNLPLKHQFIS